MSLARCQNRSTRFMSIFSIKRIIERTGSYGTTSPDKSLGFTADTVLGEIERNRKISEKDRRDETIYADVFILGGDGTLKNQDVVIDGDKDREVVGELGFGEYQLR